MFSKSRWIVKYNNHSCRFPRVRKKHEGSLWRCKCGQLWRLKLVEVFNFHIHTSWSKVDES